jgi:uncharacterized protein YlxW (UPF0749 family)
VVQERVTAPAEPVFPDPGAHDQGAGADDAGPDGATPRSGRGRRSLASTVAVTLVLVGAGWLFATSAETSRGTQLRSDRADAVDLVRSEQERLAARQARYLALQREYRERIDAEAGGNTAVRSLRADAARIEPAAGLRAVSGPALTVSLTDAPRASRKPEGVKPDDLVVHQQDVQAVVNALWAGGAEAMMVMDQRIVSTSAVRCVGNTLILQGRVYSPPYRITAVGDPAALRAALAASPQVQIYQEYVRAFGLGYEVQDRGVMSLPAYTGPLELRYATVPASSAVRTGARQPAAATASSPQPSGSASGS